MKFKERGQEEVHIELTPFIDIVFMLLLFFVVSTALFKASTQIGVQLPEANAEKREQAKSQIEVEVGVDAQGNYYLDGKEVGKYPMQLKTALLEVLERSSTASDDDHNVKLILAGDRLAPHQAIVGALEMATELHLKQVQIIAQSHSHSHETK